MSAERHCRLNIICRHFFKMFHRPKSAKKARRGSAGKNAHYSGVKSRPVLSWVHRVTRFPCDCNCDLLTQTKNRCDVWPAPNIPPLPTKPCDFFLRSKIGSDCSCFCMFSGKRTSPLRVGWRQLCLRQKIVAICDLKSFGYFHHRPLNVPF